MEIRPVTMADAADLHSLHRRWETVWNAPMVTPFEEIVEELERPHFNLDTDSLGFWEDGRVIAYGQVWHRPSGIRQERAYMQGWVDPEHRGRGLGRQLFQWQIDRGTALLLSVENDLPKYLRADEWDWIEEAHRLYLRFGFEPVRFFAEMLKPLTEIRPVIEIEDVEIVSWDRSMDERAMAVINESFADHWGSTPTDAVSFQHQLNGTGARPDLSFMAISQGQVVGVALNAHFPEDEELLGRRDGWVDVLGVVRPFRKRGIASALLQSSFAAFRAAGMTHSAIGVDTASPTDAFKLYADLGYEVTHRSITSEIQVG
ncbi:MAG TPA: GNAT family N-acetyltransferase [Acidimicrobiia bacterium]